MLIQKGGKDPEQNLAGVFAEFKINSRILLILKGEIYWKYTASIVTHKTWNGPLHLNAVNYHYQALFFTTHTT